MSSESATCLGRCTVCVIKNHRMTIRRTHRTNGYAKESKHLRQSCIMRYKSNSSLSREKGFKKKIRKRTESMHSFVCFELLCLLLPCPIKRVAGPSPHAAHRQKKGSRWKLPISDGGHHCLLSTLRRQSEEGDTAKNLGIEYIILYIISMTQNVNRFIYSPMFKYICRLYTNSLENETANASFFSLFSSFSLLFNLIFWTAMVKRPMRHRPCDAVKGIQRYKKVHSLKWVTGFAMTK